MVRRAHDDEQKTKLDDQPESHKAMEPPLPHAPEPTAMQLPEGGQVAQVQSTEAERRAGVANEADIKTKAPGQIQSTEAERRAAEARGDKIPL